MSKLNSAISANGKYALEKVSDLSSLFLSKRTRNFGLRYIASIMKKAQSPEIEMDKGMKKIS